ncbi:DnaJ domain protein [Sarcoptes scabiei]|uniref:Sar s 27 allergen (Serpin-like protein 4) n=1 Tax=Sarcoptes scabiei TaxID=52283 RepID=A0A132A3V7_SARSC|nr:Sar s 27 allergen (serpin-like protein 4) [Sarcoptes scabiei]UXI15063.1 DnaJ domain protein [Sarcoptes scabiei]
MYTKILFHSITILSILISSIRTWPEPLVLKEYVLASNYFGFNLLGKKCQENERSSLSKAKENVFLSPFSIATVMAMIQQGAMSDTFNQLNFVLGFQLARIDSDKHLLAKQIRTSLNQINSIDLNESNSLKIANALVVGKNFPIKQEFNETIRKNFDSELLEVDFVGENDLAMAIINQWCSDKTMGKINQFLQNPPSPATQLIAINAIYFKGVWKNRFASNQTEIGKFYGCNNQIFENVSFMRRQGRIVYAYLAELQSDLVELPYEGDEVSWFGILPRDRSEIDLNLIRKALNPWYIEAAISRLNEENESTIILPRLKVVGRYDLKETLKDMGLINVFDRKKADLSGINDQEQVIVDDIRHAAIMDINEEGTEAAASTYVGFVKMSLQPSTVFNFNRPFILFIRHNPTGLILFLGEINKP